MSDKEEKTSGKPPVLLVDDNFELLEVVGSTLERDGFEVARAGDGAEALKILQERRPFLILLDLMMPGMNGWDFLKMFRSDKAVSNIPVIVCSAAPVPELQGVDLIPKPIDLTRLLFIVHRYFDSRG